MDVANVTSLIMLVMPHLEASRCCHLFKISPKIEPALASVLTLILTTRLKPHERAAINIPEKVSVTLATVSVRIQTLLGILNVITPNTEALLTL